jgi:hypothetical protein
MAATENDCGELMETKITNITFMQNSLGYNVFALNAVSIRQGGNSFFWKDNNLYKIK